MILHKYFFLGWLALLLTGCAAPIKSVMLNVPNITDYRWFHQVHFPASTAPFHFSVCLSDLPPL
ncbi:MAG: hypothetical protein NZ108_05125, partial [Bacteroidia bacterium]|nr:hypothetical protein [Bacteroidia bacterium]